MTYDGKIPEFALQPAKEAEKQREVIDDGFDPTPYDRLLAREPEVQEDKEEEQEIINMEQAKEPEPEPLPEKETADLDNAENAVSEQHEETQSFIEREPESEKVEFEDMPVSGREMLPAADSVTIKPMAAAAEYQQFVIKSAVQQAETRVFVEEDILVPDVKPDMASILSMDGKVILSGKEFQMNQQDDSLRLTGEIALQTIYRPDEKEGNEPVVLIASRLPFKTEWQINASPISHLSVVPTIEKIEYTVVNERKFRSKVTLKLSMTEYAEKTIDLFEGVKGEELQLKKEKIQFTNIALRKEESLEISENFAAKESEAVPAKILKYDIHIMENHKQITSEKMVINGTILCSILYMAQREKDGETQEFPEFAQNKVDFTQFILLEKIDQAAGSKVVFDGKDLTLKIDETDGSPAFSLAGKIDTSVEVYETIEKEMVSDFYHKSSDTTYDREEKNIRTVMAAGSTEVSAREIAAIPEKYGTAGKVLYLSGEVQESQCIMDNGRCRTEGILQCRLLCLNDSEEGAFCNRAGNSIPRGGRTSGWKGRHEGRKSDLYSRFMV